MQWSANLSGLCRSKEFAANLFLFFFWRETASLPNSSFWNDLISQFFQVLTSLLYHFGKSLHNSLPNFIAHESIAADLCIF